MCKLLVDKHQCGDPQLWTIPGLRSGMVHYDHCLWSMPHCLPCKCRIIHCLMIDPGKRFFQEVILFWFSHEFSNVSTYSKRYGLWQSSVPCVTSLMLAIHENKQAQGFPEHQVVCSFSWGVETINDSFTDEANPKHRILGNAHQMPATLILTSFHLGTRAWTPTPTRAPVFWPPAVAQPCRTTEDYLDSEYASIMWGPQVWLWSLQASVRGKTW